MRDLALLIRFGADGKVGFYPVVDLDTDTPELAARLHRLCHTLIENPDVLCCAAGYHEHGHGPDR